MAEKPDYREMARSPALRRWLLSCAAHLCDLWPKSLRNVSVLETHHSHAGDTSLSPTNTFDSPVEALRLRAAATAGAAKRQQGTLQRIHGNNGFGVVVGGWCRAATGKSVVSTNRL